MKILHVGEWAGFGGAETVTATLVKQQKRLGMDVDVFFYVDQGGAVQFEGLCDVWFASDHPLAEVVLHGDYDLIHVVAAAAPRARRNLKQAAYGGPVVVSSHGWFPTSMGSRYVNAVAEFGTKQIQDKCIERVYVVYNGIEIERFYPAKRDPNRKPIIAWVGRSSDSQKDYGGLIALSESGSAEGFSIVVVDGSPDDPSNADWLTSDHEIIRQMPWTQMPDFYRSVAASGGFLLSTARVEWCPMTVLEAQACGCPIIAPAVGGIPEIVQHEVTGYLYDRKDALDGLKAGMKWLYSDDQYDQASEAATKYVAENFTAEKMCRDYLAIYEQAIAETKPSTANMILKPALRTGMPIAAAIRNLIRGRAGSK